MGQVTHNRVFRKAGPTNSGGLRKNNTSGVVTLLPSATTYWPGWTNRGFTQGNEERMYVRFDLSTVPDQVTNMANFKIKWVLRATVGSSSSWQITFGTAGIGWMNQTLNVGDWGGANTYSAFTYPTSPPNLGTYEHTLPGWWGFIFTRTGYQDFEIRDTSSLDTGFSNPVQRINWTSVSPELSFDVTYKHPGVGHKVMWTP